MASAYENHQYENLNEKGFFSSYIDFIWTHEKRQKKM